jgi:GNAT superfamily N-acetyltransferase
MTSLSPWPASLPVTQVRVARPTDRLDDVTRFYRDALGLPELFRFDGHAGYDGVMFGLPGTGYHLEFTTHIDGSPGPAPTRDNLLVLYFDDQVAQQATAARMARFGFGAVEPENPYWADNGGITIEDPDGWRVVLMPTRVFDDPASRAPSDDYVIRLATVDDLPRLREIERDAGAMFDGLGLDTDGIDSSFPHEERRLLVAMGQAWVACPKDGAAVGVIAASVRDGAAYVEELDVVPAHGRRGLGSRLLSEVVAWGTQRRLPAVVLSTFRDVPWNGPFYRSRGFRDLDPAEWTPDLFAIREIERRQGLVVDARVFMRRELADE